MANRVVDILELLSSHRWTPIRVALAGLDLAQIVITVAPLRTVRRDRIGPLVGQVVLVVAQIDRNGAREVRDAA